MYRRQIFNTFAHVMTDKRPNMTMHRFANPRRFVRLADTAMPWLAFIVACSLVLGISFSLFLSPADYQQGNSVRIMYVHVPAAWMGLFAYTVMAVSSAAALIWKHPLAHIVARSSAPIGACLTLLCLVTGALWGKPMWGAWWVWDARLTSMLILLLLYIGYIALSHSFENQEQGYQVAAVLALFGFINVPVIKFSVDWWNTLHQPASVSRFGFPAIDPSMLTPLLLMAIFFMAFYLLTLLIRVKAALYDARLRGYAIDRSMGRNAL